MFAGLKKFATYGSVGQSVDSPMHVDLPSTSNPDDALNNSSTDDYTKSLTEMLKKDKTNNTRDALLIDIASKTYKNALKSTIRNLEIDGDDINYTVDKYIDSQIESLKLQSILGKPLTQAQKDALSVLLKSAAKNLGGSIDAQERHISSLLKKMSSYNTDGTIYNNRNPQLAASVGMEHVSTYMAPFYNKGTNYNGFESLNPFIINYDAKATTLPFVCIEENGTIGNGKNTVTPAFTPGKAEITFTTNFFGGKRKSRKSSRKGRRRTSRK